MEYERKIVIEFEGDMAHMALAAAAAAMAQAMQQGQLALDKAELALQQADQLMIPKPLPRRISNGRQ